MNELQKTEFEILKSFISVCEDLNLTYYLVCGTALGAAKYQGFIPWDDDVDVGMPRKDYEIFCEKAQSLLPKQYFLQTYKTDKSFPCIYCKIRDCGTTYIEKSVASLDMNHGVYIDVFPLDGYPTKEKDIAYLEKQKRKFKLMLFCAFDENNNISFKAKLLRKAGRLLGYHKRTQATLEKYEKLISRWDIAQSNLVCNHGNWQGSLEYAPKEQYGNGASLTFEGLSVNLPEKYGEYLSQKYGDWKSDLPLEQQKGHHYYTVMDLQKPYTEYKNK